MEFSVRSAISEDYEAVCRLFAEGDAVHWKGQPDLFRAAYPSRTGEFFSGLIGNDAAGMYVAESRNALIGLVAFNVVEIPERPMMFARTYVFIDSLVVQAGHRRQGVGRALMTRVHQWASEHRLAEIALNVFEFNRGAIRFYQELGYSTLSRRMRISLSE